MRMLCLVQYLHKPVDVENVTNRVIMKVTRVNCLLLKVLPNFLLSLNMQIVPTPLTMHKPILLKDVN
jgi:hypothetical protein